MNFWQKWQLNALKKKLQQFYSARQNQNVAQTEIQKEIALWHQLANFYAKRRYDSALPHADLLCLECYRAAATLGDVHALYLLSADLINKARFWDNLGNTIFTARVHQKYARDLFDEAFTYLNAAVAQDSVPAKRLKAQVLINGWGQAIDTDAGFKLIVESIEQEHAWDRATKIIEELGLNRPEFFSSIMSVRQRK